MFPPPHRLVDGLHRHHYGIGAVDHAALGDPAPSEYERKLIAEPHRLEWT